MACRGFSGRRRFAFALAGFRGLWLAFAFRFRWWSLRRGLGHFLLSGFRQRLGQRFLHLGELLFGVAVLGIDRERLLIVLHRVGEIAGGCFGLGFRLFVAGRFRLIGGGDVRLLKAFQRLLLQCLGALVGLVKGERAIEFCNGVRQPGLALLHFVRAFSGNCMARSIFCSALSVSALEACLRNSSCSFSSALSAGAFSRAFW